MSSAFGGIPRRFHHFYLRDISVVADDLHALGPLVAAQRVV